MKNFYIPAQTGGLLVRTIANGTFSDCAIGSVFIPNAVKKIEHEVFAAQDGNDAGTKS